MSDVAHRRRLGRSNGMNEKNKISKLSAKTMNHVTSITLTTLFTHNGIPYSGYFPSSIPTIAYDRPHLYIILGNDACTISFRLRPCLLPFLRLLLPFHPFSWTKLLIVLDTLFSMRRLGIAATTAVCPQSSCHLMPSQRPCLLRNIHEKTSQQHSPCIFSNSDFVSHWPCSLQYEYLSSF